MGRFSLHSILFLLLWQSTAAVWWSRSNEEQPNLAVEIGARATGRVMRHDQSLWPTAHPGGAHSFWKRPANRGLGKNVSLFQALGDPKKKKEAKKKEVWVQTGPLGDKTPGYCVDPKGHPIQGAGYRPAKGETDCWNMCSDNPHLQACAFYYDRNLCVEYPVPWEEKSSSYQVATQSNGEDGYFCRIKPSKHSEAANNPQEEEKPSLEKPACAEKCSDEHVMSCSTYKAWTKPGGCAEFCDEATQAKYELFLCGRVPQCAQSCSDKLDATCETYTRETGEGGCAAECSEALKLEFKAEYCGVEKPACASTCPDDVVPTCSTFSTFTAEGGCASGCSPAINDHYAKYVCGRKPLCAAKCPEDVSATCAMVDDFEAGCASECTDTQKHQFRIELCGVKKPDCAMDCPDDVAPTCKLAATYSEPGGCASDCSKEVNALYSRYVCGKVPLCAGHCEEWATAEKIEPTCDNIDQFIGKGGCAESCTQPEKNMIKFEVCNPLKDDHVSRTYHGEGHENEGRRWGEGEQKGHNAAYPETIQQAEQEVEKIDKVIEGAEAEAAMPDSVHTTAPPEDEEEEKNQQALLGCALMCCACCWCGICCAFHKWVFGSSKKKDAAGEASETEGES